MCVGGGEGEDPSFAMDLNFKLQAEQNIFPYICSYGDCILFKKKTCIVDTGAS